MQPPNADQPQPKRGNVVRCRMNASKRNPLPHGRGSESGSEFSATFGTNFMMQLLVESTQKRKRTFN